MLTYHELFINCRRLFLQDYCLDMLIGILPQEQHIKQSMLFNIDLFVPLNFSCSKRDAIDDVLDYNVMIDTIKTCSSKQYNLQETLCDELLHIFLQHNEVCAARVNICKLNAYKQAKAVGVERFDIKNYAKK